MKASGSAHVAAYVRSSYPTIEWSSGAPRPSATNSVIATMNDS